MIFKFFIFLQIEKKEYVLLNGYQDIFSNYQTNSDIDLLFRKDDFLRIENIIRVFCEKHNFLLVQIFHQGIWAKNIFIYDPISKKLLNLDIYGELARKNIIYFNEVDIFQNTQLFKKIPILASHHEFIYYLIKKLDKNDLTHYNFKHLLGLYKKESDLSNNLLDNFFPKKNDVIIRAFNNNSIDHLNENSKLLVNDFTSLKRINILNFLKDKWRFLKRIFKPTGITICFLGPDGSGKSTIIDALKNSPLPFRRVDYFHLKPKVIGKVSNQVVTNPHASLPYSKIKSYAKLFYFVLQYNVGWLKNIVPIKIKSSLVIFDRYYDDLLVDKKRYRYGGSIKFAKIIRNFIPKPELYFILTTDSNIIIKRKQEVSLKELEMQLSNYKQLSDGKRYFDIEVNRPPSEIVLEVTNIIMNKMNERY